MSDVSLIGPYQLENLQKNKVGFLFLDLDASRALAHHALLVGSEAVAVDQVLEFVKQRSLGANQPIVLICENGARCLTIAHLLEENSYINVFVVEGGKEALK